MTRIQDRTRRRVSVHVVANLSFAEGLLSSADCMGRSDIVTININSALISLPQSLILSFFFLILTATILLAFQVRLDVAKA
jgi:hypothetical protein